MAAPFILYLDNENNSKIHILQKTSVWNFLVYYCW